MILNSVKTETSLESCLVKIEEGKDIYACSPFQCLEIIIKGKKRRKLISGGCPLVYLSIVSINLYFLLTLAQK